MKKIDYRVVVLDVTDNEGLPVSITMSVDCRNQKSFEEWLVSQEGNMFSHAAGGNIEY